MKRKSLHITHLLIAFGVIVSCSQKQTSPEEVTLSFFNLLYNEHDIEKAELLVTESSKEKLRNDFKYIEGALQIVEENEPTKYEYNVLKERSVVSNDSAFVFITSTLDTSMMKILLLQINKEWKVDFNYDEQSLNMANKDLVDDMLKVMEQFADTSAAEKTTAVTK